MYLKWRKTQHIPRMNTVYDMLTFYKIDTCCQMLLLLDQEKSQMVHYLIAAIKSTSEATKSTSDARFKIVNHLKNGKFISSQLILQSWYIWSIMHLIKVLTSGTQISYYSFIQTFLVPNQKTPAMILLVKGSVLLKSLLSKAMTGLSQAMQQRVAGKWLKQNCYLNTVRNSKWI